MLFFHPFYHRYARNIFSVLVLSFLLFPKCVLSANVSKVEMCNFDRERQIVIQVEEYIERFNSFTSSTSIEEIKEFMCEFRCFVSSVVGKSISGFELHKLVKQEINRSNFDVLHLENIFLSKEEMASKAFLARSSINQRKNIQGNSPDVEIDTDLILGGVAIACGILVGSIGVAVPFLAPTTSNLAVGVISTGFVLFMNGLSNTSKKNLENYSR